MIHTTSFTLVKGSWQKLQEDASSIRFEVFVDEQNVPAAIELDELDPECQHIVAYDGTTPMATGRLLPDGHIGRMAVRQSARGTGLGSQVLQGLIQIAKARGDTEVILSAQTHALGFYEKHGFVAEGEEYLDADIPHKTMRLVF